MRKFIANYGLYIAWATSLLALLGSLYFSQILHLPPCILCWYQRICMYPLVFILGAAILKKDQNVTWYALPLSIIGLLIAIYHNLLYYKILPESVAPCVNGVSCTSRTIELLGFITIPLLALVGFGVITAILIAYSKINKNN